MQYRALACDYDGTLASQGRVTGETLTALLRLRASGRKLILATGRELSDLMRVCPHLDLFDRVVAENGALLYRPSSGDIGLLCEPPSAEFIRTLLDLGVEPLHTGHVIVSTREPNEDIVRRTIRSRGLDLHITFNKGAIMILPYGVDKASGLTAALKELGLSPENVAGVGDAENDHAFLDICKCAIAVGNALDSVKERADLVTIGEHGEGVTELIGYLIDSDLSEIGPGME